jgi:LuxR family maltose regulon positive regulatory protein
MRAPATVPGMSPAGMTLPPGLPPHYIQRPGLLARLGAVRAPITVLSAPTGWGKTTLLASWAAGEPGRAVWVTGGDRDGFWRGIVSAVAAIAGSLPSGLVDTVTETDGPRRLSAVLRRAATPLTIVVDDCNDAASPDELAGLAQAAVSSAGRAGLILACRGDPALALHRWRADDQLTEFFSEDLAFGVDESADLFADYGVALPWLAIAELHARTEGWPVGLRLAATALQRGTEPAQVVARSAAVGPVGDYLAAEVLTGLPAQAREVLMEISVAERVTAGLVNALTGRVDGAAVLTDLQRRGAFIMRCPGIDDTYRLHTMFSRALYQELGRHDQTRTVRAHGRAADWYLAQGPAVEALRHLLAAGDWERAARVLDNHWADVVVGSRRLNLPEIVSFAPDRDLPRHLWLAMAAERLDAGDAVAMRHLVRLASADQASESGAEDVPPYLLSAFRLAAARLDGDVSGACSVASQALAAPVPAEEPYTSASTTLRPIALLALGTAKLQLGHVPAAGDHLQEALALARQRDMETVEISTASHLAAWHAALGHLHDAVDCAGEALELGNRFGLGQLADLGWARLALAEAYFQWNRLDDSGRCADAAVDNSCGDRLIQLWGTILQVRIRTATGRLEDAHRMVRAAQREMVTSDLPAPVKRALSLVDGELRLACGDLAGARECATAWPGSDPLPGPAAVLEGSILLAEGRPGLAASVVAPFVSDDDRCPSLTFRASAGLITALAGQALGHRERMTRGLDIALKAAEEEGLRRCFTAGGQAVRALIESVAPMMFAYPPVVAALTAPLDPMADDITERRGPARPGAVPAGSLVEPLTSRELTVLRYLQGTLSHVEIAALLHISVNTVKTHVKNIYRKLGTGRRKDAIRRGHELRML